MQALFDSVISILSSNKIPYAIVGRTELYPNQIDSDVDIMIDVHAIDIFHKAIWNIESEDTKVVQMIQHEVVAFYYVVYKITEESCICIKPDGCTDYYRKGRKLLSSTELLKTVLIAPQGGFCILAPEKEFIYYLLKKIDKRSLSIEQFKHIFNSYIVSPRKAMNEARSFWSDSNLEILNKAFAEKDYEYLNANLKILQKGIHEAKKMSLGDKCRNYALKIKRICHPTGLNIAIMGPDGSGKTTVIEQMKKDMGDAFRRIQYFHLYPKPGSHGVVRTDPHNQKVRGLILSVLKLLYFVVLYNVGFLWYVIPMKIKSTMTIFDRYYDDILVDPIRYRNGTPKWVVKFIRCFIPQPDLWIILDAPTDVIQKRKAEVSAEETERQRQAYIKLAKSKQNAILINTDRDIKLISSDISKFMCEYLNKRAIKRYKP